ncbi:hypothetical protein FS749_011106 [Ceratobasidium sp. UAMH 11750]|nr:hypothetical protein FS749_011106 [Ceratobasidium sp. UAMH 11750]
MATNHVPVPAAQAALSLLSLSSSTSPHAASPPPSVSTPALGRFVHAQRSTASVVKPSAAASGTSSGRRRLSGAVQTRRRMSDAASAAASPAVVLPLRNGAAASPSVGESPLASGIPAPVPAESETPTNGGGKAKKGTIFKCETCSKVYRHPNCLVKHRWEHSPHWREASKFLLSKHQQVQMLEAAAILSHISPQKNGVGTSLPEDRSLWPAYLSGGLLPTPGTSAPTAATATLKSTTHTDYREREQSVSTSAVDDQDDDQAMSGESSVEDDDHDREDSGYGSSSAMAVPGYQPRTSPQYNTAMSFGGREYTLSSSHAGCDAGAHLGSMRLGMGRSVSSSSFGMSSLRGARRDREDQDEMEEEDEGHGEKHGLKWEEDVSMAMDMDL